MKIMVDQVERLARTERMAEMLKSQQPDVQQRALYAAVANEDEEGAAAIARAIRNRLLAETDAEMALDRMQLKVPTGAGITAWLDFLKGLGAMLTGEWADYRQALRTLPEQEGFPLVIQWPKAPGDAHGSGEVVDL